MRSVELRRPVKETRRYWDHWFVDIMILTPPCRLKLLHRTIGSLVVQMGRDNVPERQAFHEEMYQRLLKVGDETAAEVALKEGPAE